MDDFDSAYERDEEKEEARKGLEAFTQAMIDHPEVAQKLVDVQRSAFQQSIGVVHVCGLCKKKQRFVHLVELITLVNILSGNDRSARLLYAIEWAQRVPAARLEAFGDLITPALDLVKWCQDPETHPQPDWYEKGPMENEGGHE